MSGPVLLVLRLLMAASLFAFLGLAFYLLWRDLRQQATLLSSQQHPGLSLQRSPINGEAPNRYNLIEVLVGRDPSCDCVLDETTVSAQHTRLSFRQGHWWAEDLHSTNGTFLNQEPVTGPVVVASGDELRCGQVVLIISIGETS
jgi:hypothetical protein